MASNIVRTRFAPSPTGYMHVGNLRTALYAFLKAKSAGGTFILRIEDTDQERYVEGAVDIIYNTLRETGLIWDEGPDIGGPVGPYVQSERMGMFKGYAEQLVKEGKAYYCFCDKERLDEMRLVQKASGQAPHYDGHCRSLSPQEVQAKLDAGLPYVIRQKCPKPAPPALRTWCTATSRWTTPRWMTRSSSRPTACPPTTSPTWWTTI